MDCSPPVYYVRGIFQARILEWGAIAFSEVALVVSNSLHPYGLQPARLLHLWNSPGKNTGVGYHVSSRGSSDPGIEPASLMSPALAGGFFTTVRPSGL